MQLAPDGKHLAFLSVLGFGKVGVALMDLTTGKYEALVSAWDENIKTFFWKGSDYIVYAGDIGGEESYAWRSIPIQPPKSGKRRVVALSEAYRERYNEEANFMNVIDQLKFDSRKMLIYGRSGKGSSTLGMMLIDVSSGRRATVGDYDPVEHDYDVAYNDTEDLADNLGRLRARTRMDGRATVVVEVRPEPGGRYEKVAEFPMNKGGWDLLFFAADNETLYLFSRERSDTRTLYSFNVRTRQLSAPIFQAPAGEITRVLTSWDRSKLYGVLYEADKPRLEYFDAGRRQLQKAIDASLPDTFNLIVSSSADEQILLILSSSDRDPGTYYVFDRPHGRISPVGKVKSAIKPEQMRPMVPVAFTARDGLVINGYLTRPAGSTDQRVPLIIHPHGGPYGIRDSWGFDPSVQFLANRGYAVLQVNYRGSGGYGSRFEEAGYQEWGGKMQDDLTDAVKWAVDQGIADPARVAIYGASYGGYAALAGLVFSPELYCCGANYLGPSDLGLLVGLGKGRSRSESNQAFFSLMIGDNRQVLAARSPVNHIERLRAPLFNAYGYNDSRVDFRHWTRLEEKLKREKKAYEILVEDNEGHGFQNEKNRMAFYRRLESFFARYLAPAPTGK